jgi:hypothetical protein
MMANTQKTATREHTKAPRKTEVYVVMLKLLRADAYRVPPPKTITIDAPKHAAEEMPNVNGEASGFLVEVCVTIPPRAKPAPARIAINALGSRLSQIIKSTDWPPDKPNGERSDLNKLKRSIWYEPIDNETKKATIRRIVDAVIKSSLRLPNFLYSALAAKVLSFGISDHLWWSD